MNDESFTSGFVKADIPFNETAFTDIQEIYSSSSGYNRLFRCHRYGKLHVLKTLQPLYKETAFCEQALQKEFNIGYQLEHPHICRTLGWERTTALGHCILLEYIDGMTLKDFMQQGKLTQPLAVKIITELCSALQYIHSKQIVHRDLKPGNILITYNGNNVKLIDFSLSDCDDYDVLKLPAGTRYYLAPETLQPETTLDLRADIYSLGVIIGEMATLLKDKHLASVSRKCTRQKREKRYSSAMEVAKVITQPRKTLYYIVGAISLLAVGVSLAFLFGWGSHTPVPTSVSYPVYGNQISSENCRRLLASERIRMIHSVDSLKYNEHRLKSDSLQLMRQLQEVMDMEFPSPELRQSVVYQRQWEGVQEEANRLLAQIRQSINSYQKVVEDNF